MSRALLLSSLLCLTVGCAGASSGLRARGARFASASAPREPMVVTNRYITGLLRRSACCGRTGCAAASGTSRSS